MTDTEYISTLLSEGEYDKALVLMKMMDARHDKEAHVVTEHDIDAYTTSAVERSFKREKRMCPRKDALNYRNKPYVPDLLEEVNKRVLERLSIIRRS